MSIQTWAIRYENGKPVALRFADAPSEMDHQEEWYSFPLIALLGLVGQARADAFREAAEVVSEAIKRTGAPSTQGVLIRLRTGFVALAQSLPASASTERGEDTTPQNNESEDGSRND